VRGRTEFCYGLFGQKANVIVNIFFGREVEKGTSVSATIYIANYFIDIHRIMISYISLLREVFLYWKLKSTIMTLRKHSKSLKSVFQSPVF